MMESLSKTKWWEMNGTLSGGAELAAKIRQYMAVTAVVVIVELADRKG